MRIPFRRPVATVMQFDNVPRWFIRFPLPLPHGDRVPDWTTCPGTLYQDYPTRAEAVAVARWWGYRV